MTEFSIIVEVLSLIILIIIVVMLNSMRTFIKRANSNENVRLTQQLESLDRLYFRLDLPRGALPPSRGWAASPDFLNILYEEVISRRPKNVVECGSGLTTLVTARALEQLGGGRILSLEHDKSFADLTLHNLRLLDLAEYVDLRVAPLVLQTISGVEYQWYDVSVIDLPEKIDFITVDGPPEPIVGAGGRYPVGPALFHRLSKTGAVLFDDSNRPGEKAAIRRVLEEFPYFDTRELPAEKGCNLLEVRAK